MPRNSARAASPTLPDHRKNGHAHGKNGFAPVNPASVIPLDADRTFADF